MKRDNSRWQPVQSAVVHWHDTRAPYSPAFDDIYYSPDNGVEESHYVFLAGNGLPERWLQHPRTHFCVGETGFGTGLNFLLTWQAWRKLPDSRPDLHFVSFEQQPLDHADLRGLWHYGLTYNLWHDNFWTLILASCPDSTAYCWMMAVSDWTCGGRMRSKPWSIYPDVSNGW